MLEFWQEWRDVMRHNHPVTVEDVLINFKIEKGRLDELEARVPRPLPEDPPGLALKKGLLSIWVRFTQLRERRGIYRRTRKVREQIIDPAPLRRKVVGEDLYVTQLPFITDYAYILDLFAHEYGWKEAQVRAFPYAAISELVLAMENRWVRQRSDLVNAAHPSEESIAYMTDYPRRGGVKIPGHILAQENMKKTKDFHSAWSGKSEGRTVH